MKFQMPTQQRPCQMAVVRFMTWFILLLGSVFSGINFAIHNFFLAGFEAFIVGFCLFLLIILDRTERLQFWIFIFLTLIFLAICIGIDTLPLETGVALWLWTIPIMSILMLGLLQGAVVSLLFLTVGLAVFFLHYLALGHSIHPLLVVNALTSLICLWVFSYVYARYQRAMIDTLQDSATRDPLTGLNNRRHLRSVFEQIQSGHRRTGRPFALLVLDIDWFKKVNDTCGHDLGDRILVHLGEMMTQHTRRQDWLFRLGGEEFCILLPDTMREEAIMIAERLRMDFASKLFRAHGKLVRSSISIGIGTAPEDGIDYDILFTRADQRLYAAKNGGRNRVVAA